MDESIDHKDPDKKIDPAGDLGEWTLPARTADEDESSKWEGKREREMQKIAVTPHPRHANQEAGEVVDGHAKDPMVESAERHVEGSAEQPSEEHRVQEVADEPVEMLASLQAEQTGLENDATSIIDQENADHATEEECKEGDAPEANAGLGVTPSTEPAVADAAVELTPTTQPVVADTDAEVTPIVDPIVADAGVEVTPTTQPVDRSDSLLSDEHLMSVERAEVRGVTGESEQGGGDRSVGSDGTKSDTSDEQSTDEHGMPVARPIEHDEGRVESIRASTRDVMDRVLLDDDARMRILGEHVSIAVLAPSRDVDDEEEAGAIEEEPKSFRSWVEQRWPWSGVLLLVITALVVSAAVAVGLALAGGDSAGTAPTPALSPSAGDNPPSTAPSASPSFSPTKAPTTEAYRLLRNAVDPVLGELDVVDGSPQQKALFWLEFDDGFQINVAEDVKKVQQRFALATFYFATGGDSWENNLSFMTDEDECNWNANFQGSTQGVVNCGNGWVTQLIFNSDLLVGSIPPEIQAWRNLTLLEISNNPGLTNPIPEETTKLTALERLAVVDGNLTGTLPLRIGRMTSLTELMLSGNSIGGSTPESIGNCTSLQILSMNKNQLVGPLPSTLGNLVKLKELDLSRNGLTGSVPREVRNMASLEKVLLNGNDIIDGMDNFCTFDRPISFFMADCGSSSFPNIPAQVPCSCCTFCCSEVDACSPS